MHLSHAFADRTIKCVLSIHRTSEFRVVKHRQNKLENEVEN